MRAPATADIFGRRAMRRVTAQDFVSWAVGMLELEQDSPSLRMLASMDAFASTFEAEDYFIRAVRELGIPEPADGLRAYACDVAKRIVVGDIPPRQGVRELFQVWIAADGAAEYLIWLELDDALDNLEAGVDAYTYPSATAENFDAITCAEARAFLERMNESPPTEAL